MTNFFSGPDGKPTKEEFTEVKRVLTACMAGVLDETSLPLDDLSDEAIFEINCIYPTKEDKARALLGPLLALFGKYSGGNAAPSAESIDTAALYLASLIQAKWGGLSNPNPLASFSNLKRKNLQALKKCYLEVMGILNSSQVKAVDISGGSACANAKGETVLIKTNHPSRGVVWEIAYPTTTAQWYKFFWDPESKICQDLIEEGHKDPDIVWQGLLLLGKAMPGFVGTHGNHRGYRTYRRPPYPEVSEVVKTVDYLTMCTYIMQGMNPNTNLKNALKSLESDLTWVYRDLQFRSADNLEASKLGWYWAFVNLMSLKGGGWVAEGARSAGHCQVGAYQIGDLSLPDHMWPRVKELVGGGFNSGNIEGVLDLINSVYGYNPHGTEALRAFAQEGLLDF